MGPEIEYATQSIDPLEIRVYGGSDAHFVLYEDEGDTYNYEAGQYSLILFTYSEASRQLTIGARQGTYSTMPQNRTFDVVFVDSSHGTGIDVSSAYDTVVHYDGSEVITSVDENQHDTPARFTLEQNYPNPVNPSTTIRYELPKASHVMLTVYDVLGREVATLVNDVEEPGYKSVQFDASRLSSGVYFYRLQAGDFAQTMKLVLMK